MKILKIIPALFVLLFISAACSHEKEFSRERWNDFDREETNSGFSYDFHQRKSIAKDLRENYLHNGTSHDEVIDLLGNPQVKGLEQYYYREDTLVLTYLLEMKGWMIMSGADGYPHKLSYLRIFFDKDSTVVNTSVSEWETEEFSLWNLLPQ